MQPDWGSKEYKNPYDIDELVKQLGNRTPVRGATAAADPYGRRGFVPWRQSTLDANKKLRKRPMPTMALPELPDPTPRPTAEKVHSLMMRLVDQAQKTGQIPVSSKLLTELQVEFAKSGHMEMTGENIRKLAQGLIQRAEKTNKEAAEARRRKELDQKLREGAPLPVQMNRSMRRALAKAAHNKKGK